MTPDEYTQAVDDGNYPKDPVVPMETPFVDERGVIQNLLLKPMTSAAMIVSKKGSVRANHLHRTDWHYAYVVSGEILYFERDIGSTEIPEPMKFTAGQMFFTPPMREHAMLFSQDTVFLTLAKNVRSHENHEADLERVSFVTEEVVKRYV
jgi:dTDP-4-dehydrorhamnose 3,5-epimerase-like enzyme